MGDLLSTCFLRTYDPPNHSRVVLVNQMSKIRHLYTTKVVMMGVYERCTHVQLAPQKEKVIYQTIFFKINIQQKKEEIIVEWWETTTAKVGMELRQ